MSTLKYRQQYAKTCLLKGRTNTRGFDNCFENDDGDKVVRYLMNYAMFATPEREQWFNDIKASGTGIKHDSPEHNLYRKIKTSLLLRERIKAIGLWDGWLWFIEHGTYAGFTKPREKPDSLSSK